ncbi:putative membrane protein [Clostridioides difficile CD160]|uniref:Uncharacterized protein n=1 Tax=Clostridioides difficile TaxID=1496 RepID=A0A386JC26_CLODI|nr:hypothetical protein pHSJD-312_00118 [Clostridioides difficile]EQF29805.1 putative membrane protein [Clostridioides difficile CD160]
MFVALTIAIAFLGVLIYASVLSTEVSLILDELEEGDI